MTKIILFAVLAGASLTSPVHAFAAADGLYDAAMMQDGIDRRKRRIPGGSGCDDPEDLIEHPECIPA